MTIQPESARDKQIIAFSRRQAVISAAIEFARLESCKGQGRREAAAKLVAAVRAYRPGAML